MATQKIEQLGTKLDIDVRRGVTFGPVVHELLYGDASPVDLTGYAFRGQIRRNEMSANVIASFTFSAPEADLGRYEFSLPDEVTSALQAGLSMGAPQSQYRYDTEMESPSGEVTPLLYGRLRVQADVTR